MLVARVPTTRDAGSDRGRTQRRSPQPGPGESSTVRGAGQGMDSAESRGARVRQSGWLWLLVSLVLVAPWHMGTAWADVGLRGEDVAASQAQPRRDAILYAVRAPGARAANFVLGTIHSDDPRVLDLGSGVRQAFDRSSGFAMEVVPDPQAIIRAMIRMTYGDGRSLRDVLPEDLYPRVAAALEERGMPPAAYRDLKPWAVVSMLSAPAGSHGEFLDLALHARAVETGKHVLGLETMEEQLAVFDDLSLDDQIALLRETLDNLERLPGMLAVLIETYIAGDLDALMAQGNVYLNAGDPRLAAQFRETAIDARNRRMVERMYPLLDEGGWFIAVGAMHLGAETGVLSLLEQRGYVIEGLSSDIPGRHGASGSLRESDPGGL